jgi:hypothetical protein
MNQLFDKIVDIKFYDKGKVLVDKINIPQTGMKPNINIQGHLVMGNVLQDLIIRIVNFYPSLPLNKYAWVEIYAGYKESQTKSVLSGQITYAQQSSPSPDGVTEIYFLPGAANDLMNTPVSLHYPQGSTVSDVFNGLTDALTSNSSNVWSINLNIPNVKSHTLDQAGFNCNDTVLNVLYKLKNRFNIIFDIDGSVLNIYDAKAGKGREAIEINYVSSPPQASAAGITFVAPWMPELKPGMEIKIDPKYFRQNFGAANVSLRTNLLALSLDFQFNTVTDANSMTVLALNTVEVT